MNRELETLEILKVYFKKAPFLLGEVFFLSGTYGVFIYDFSGVENFLIPLVLMVSGGYFVIKKILTAFRAKKCMKYGIVSKCLVENESSTSLEHNGRNITKYSISYKDGDSIYFTEFWSAYHRNIRPGMSYLIFYLKENPNYSFIPELYNIYAIDISKYQKDQ